MSSHKWFPTKLFTSRHQPDWDERWRPEFLREEWVAKYDPDGSHLGVIQVAGGDHPTVRGQVYNWRGWRVYSSVRAAKQGIGNTLGSWSAPTAPEPAKTLPFVYDERDGDIGKGNCGVRALAIAADLPYATALRILKDAHIANRYPNKDPENGVVRWIWQWTFEAMGAKQTILKKRTRMDKLPMDKRLVVLLPRHLFALINGVVRDTRKSHQTHRGNLRSTKEFWTFPNDGFDIVRPYDAACKHLGEDGNAQVDWFMSRLAEVGLVPKRRAA